MKTLGERIKQRRIELNLTQDEIGQAFNPSLQRSAISKWERDYSVPDISRLPLLAKKLKTSVGYLITGDTTKEKNLSTTDPLVVDKNNENDFIWIDVVEANFSCGLGESIEFHFDTVTDKMPFSHDFFNRKNVSARNMKIIKAIGDSMGDLIQDGDCVGIDISQTHIIDGGIYAVYFMGEGMIKQIFKEENGSLVLHSINPKYKDRIVTEKNGMNFKVMGRQFWRAG